MTDRFELNSSRDTYRLQKLAGFQIKILRSALTRYPNVKKVVYSTCSLNPEENEDVVRQVLETNNEFKLVPADTFMNKAWINFGSSDFGNIGKYCLYARPDEDLTNGFFLAVFERLKEGENNEFYNGRVLNYRKNMDQKQARKHKKNWNNKDVDISKDNNENNMEIDTSRIIKTKKHIRREGLDNKFIENNVTDYSHEDIRIDKPKRKKIQQKTESSNISEELDSKNEVQDNLEAHVARKSKEKKREHTEELTMIANDSSNLFRKVKSSKKSKKKKHTLENVDGCEQSIIKYDTNERNEINCADKQKSHKMKQTKVVKETHH